MLRLELSRLVEMEMPGAECAIISKQVILKKQTPNPLITPDRPRKLG